jgi:hypothetical protein
MFTEGGEPIGVVVGGGLGGLLVWRLRRRKETSNIENIKGIKILENIKN